jgi:hypothetical protein
MDFNAEQYWSTREYKKWVVLLSKHRGFKTKAVASDVILVRARTSAKAIATARHHSTLTGNVSACARLANPWDLGCVEYTPPNHEARA